MNDKNSARSNSARFRGTLSASLLLLAGSLTLPAQSQRILSTNRTQNIRRIQSIAPPFTAPLNLQANSPAFFIPLDPARHILHITDTPLPSDVYMKYTDVSSNWAQFGLPTQWAIFHTQTDLAWGIWQPKDTKPIIIAIVDTGVDDTHPDLTNMVLRDANGAVIGYNSLTKTQGPTTPDHPHGTHVAGIAAAQTNNGMGIAGIAGWTGDPKASDTTHIKIMPVKVLDATGNGTEQQVADGIDWAVAHGASIINMSLGDWQPCPIIAQSVANAWSAGCLVVCAAGNQGNSDPFYPASSPGAVSVSSSYYDPLDTLDSWSNYGPLVMLDAPGDTIASTIPNNQYAYESGTSMASPHVAGLAALIWAQNPALTNAEVYQYIRNTVDVYPATGMPAGFRYIEPNSGRINSFSALKAVNAGMGTVSGAVTLEGCQNVRQTINFHFHSTDGKMDFTYPANLTAASGANSGAFTLSNIPAAAYNVSVKGAKWLQKTLPLTVTSMASPPASFNVALFAGDANNDNAVDTSDFNLLVGSFGASLSDAGSGYDVRADFNCDGMVDTSDFNLLAGNFGQQGDN